MDKIKINMKKIWNSKCKYLVMIVCALILMNGMNLLQTSLKFLNANGEEAEEIGAVEIEADGWEDREPGSFHITKSAKWTGYKEATIKFELDTAKKIVKEKQEEIIEGISGADIILVLDTSGSMKTKDRLVHLKQGATDLVNEILSEGNHKIALISFNGSATLRSSLTSDKTKLVNQINSLTPSGSTSYANAYKAVINLLSGYSQNQNRDLVMLFLTDGTGGSAKAQYQVLKDTYDITIVGIQYDMGTSIKQKIVEISDKQYLADTSNIKSILYQTIRDTTDKIQVTEFMKGVNYETFEISDYVSKEFYVKSASDIKVSRGSVKLETTSDGTQKVIWSLTDNEEFPTGDSATMTIKTTYQGELDSEHVYPTNKKEEISTKIEKEDVKTITSELTPQLRGGYHISYNPNLPRECNADGKELITVDSAFSYEEIELPKNEYTCSGWQFKEWGFQPEGLATVDNKFIVPDSDANVVGIWTKLEISKKMEGTIALPAEPTISYQLSYLKSSNSDEKILSGKTYTTTLSPTNSLLYGRPSSIQVYMNGSLITDYTYNNVNGNLSIPNVIGDLKIIATADVLSNENISFERPKVLSGTGTVSYVAVTQARQLRILAFTPTETRTYTFYSSDSNASANAVDPYAYLFTESDTVTIATLDAAAEKYAASGTYTDLQNQSLVYNDDGGEGYNFKMTYNCQAGKTYYLAIRTYTTDKVQTFYNIIIQ